MYDEDYEFRKKIRNILILGVVAIAAIIGIMVFSYIHSHQEDYDQITNNQTRDFLVDTFGKNDQKEQEAEKEETVSSSKMEYMWCRLVGKSFEYTDDKGKIEDLYFFEPTDTTDPESSLEKGTGIYKTVSYNEKGEIVNEQDIEYTFSQDGKQIIIKEGSKETTYDFNYVTNESVQIDGKTYQIIDTNGYGDEGMVDFDEFSEPGGE